MGEEKSVLELSFQMGEILLRNGAEISRVQETMERVAQAYQVEKFNVYVLTNAIFAVGMEQGKERSVELRLSLIHISAHGCMEQRVRRAYVSGGPVFEAGWKRTVTGTLVDAASRRGSCGPGNTGPGVGH